MIVWRDLGKFLVDILTNVHLFAGRFCMGIEIIVLYVDEAWE